MSAKNLFEFDTEALVRAMMVSAGIKTGLWRFATKYRIGTVAGHFGSTEAPDASLAALLAGLDRAALIPADKPGDLVFDAAMLLAKKDVGAKAVVFAPAAAQKSPARKKTSQRKTASTKKG